jgi:HK97 gp10 family phage protein
VAKLIGVRVKVDASELNGIISRLPDAAAQATEMAADEIVRLAKVYAPVDTGYMRDHIQKVGFGTTWAALSEAFYSMYVEFGTRFMAARPFMRPAAERVNLSQVILKFYKLVGL